MSIGTGDIIDDTMTTAKLDSVYIVWSEQDSDIMFKRNAISFDPTINLSNTAGSSYPAALAVSGSNVYVVYDFPVTGNSEILYRKSTNDGDSFGSTGNLSNTTENSVSPRVAASNNLSL
jgi:hypothetical protein